ncbi:hypothetical protein H4R18_004502 [Coemansia javaensis]|uniref:WD40 repeat-like protein n=1 Tax=Coemansia javaensis TaxID=2761396 RepID=A0A9W8H424_9FUNG|nr:hypothetical protein H4R18_004502 [Coemansia javaensis]
MHPLVAATSSAIRVWDLDVSNAPGQDSGQQQQQQQQQRSHYGFLSTRAGDYAGPQAQLRVRLGAEHAADSAADAIEAIAAVSWAANGSTFVAGGRGAVIRQYGRAGESLQDVGLGRGMTRDTGMQVVAIQHYGEGSNALFVADNTVRRVRRWDFVKREYTTVCQTHSNPISCMAVCPRKRLVASAAAQGGEIALFNLLHNTQTDLRSATHRALTCIGVAAGHRSLVSVGSEDGLVQVFDAARSSGAPLRTFSRVHTAPLRGIYSHPTSHSTLVSAGLDRRIVVTDVDAYPGASRAKGSLEIVAKAPLTCLARSQDPHAICAGTIDGDVLVYDPRMPAAPLWSGCVRPGHAVLDPPPPPTTTTTLGQLAAPTRGEAGYPAADGADDMAILAKDRSYMDLLSPTKPADLAPGRIAPLAPARTSPLSILSNGRIDSTPPQREHPGLSLAAELAGASSTPGNAAEATDVEFVSPMPRAWPPHNGQAERSRPRDAGDSMMEMFTPEKNSVLQNAVADALAPLCEQIRGEIRNLHLDMIRQGFVSQEQIKALRQEGGEARALRAEVERLRHENERLRRYVPFFQLSGDDAGGA